MNTRTKRAGSLFALLWLGATSTAVMAQQTESIGQITSAANNGTDKSMSVLQMVFGSIETNPLSGGNSGSGGMLAQVFLVLNGCILAVGAIWAVYHFVSA